MSPVRLLFNRGEKFLLVVDHELQPLPRQARLEGLAAVEEVLPELALGVDEEVAENKEIIFELFYFLWEIKRRALTPRSV